MDERLSELIYRAEALLERFGSQLPVHRRTPGEYALLRGSRGTGKSSLIKALLKRYGDAGLRLIEVERSELVDLPEIAALLRNRPERFILFCDDLSFEAGNPGNKAL